MRIESRELEMQKQGVICYLYIHTNNKQYKLKIVLKQEIHNQERRLTTQYKNKK